MGFLPLLPSCGKRMNYGIFATFAIMWQKWQKDELWDFCHFCHMWQKWQKDEIFATFAIMWQMWQKDELWDFCHFCHHVASGKRINYRIFATFAIGPGRLCQSFCLLFYSFIPVDDAHYSV